MPCKKHRIIARYKNAKRAREARVQSAQSEFCRPLTPVLIPADIVTPRLLQNKGILIDSDDRPLQPAVGEWEGGQVEEEINIDDCLEIVEQSALDHFSAVLQEAQRAAAKAEKENPRKRPKRYDSTSKRTLKQRKQFREDQDKKGFHTLFEFMARMEEKVKKKADMEKLVASVSAIEIEKSESEESAPEPGTEDLVSKRVVQVRRRKSVRDVSRLIDNHSPWPERRKTILRTHEAT